MLRPSDLERQLIFSTRTASTKSRLYVCLSDTWPQKSSPYSTQNKAMILTAIIAKALGASDVLYLITIYLSKCCVVTIFLRLTPQASHKKASLATLAVCTLWVIASILIITINCEFNRPWADAAKQCTNLVIQTPHILYSSPYRLTWLSSLDGSLSP
jgi:hypothetical protein